MALIALGFLPLFFANLHSSGTCPSAGPAKGRIKPDNMIVLSFIRLFHRHQGRGVGGQLAFPD